MPYDKKDENPYMDGVPVKISEKYKRPPVIRLPNIRAPPSVLQEEYDFRLERNILSKLQDWKKAKEEQAQKREERLKGLEPVEENTEQLQPEQPEMNDASHVLTPTNVSNTDQVTIRSDQSAFNYSDFETDTSSPFDNVELKTINEMEILASVLSSSTGSKPPSLPSNNNNKIPTKNGVVWNGFMYSSPQQYYEPTMMYPMYGSEPSQTWMSSYTVNPVAGHSGAYRYNNSVDTSGEESRVRSNSRSVPDLVLELENELKEKQKFEEMRRKTKTPPPRSVASKGLEDWKPWPDIESPRHSDMETLSTLPISQRALAKDIREMGFPLDRIVRTMKHFNGDDKKVIEFLLQVQRFEEKKFKGDLVESALHANKYDEKETLKHLEAALVLLDLGFEREKVQRVLLESQNDRDAALERLIS